MPQNTPPYTAESSMSSVAAGRGSQSMNSESPSIASSERTPKRTPMRRMDTRNSGTFSAMFTAPTLMKGRKWLTSWPTPVNPPDTMRLGIRYSL